jgi:hypothetical protein
MARSAPRVVSGAASTLVSQMAVQDWLLLGFHSYINLRLALAPDGPDASLARRLALTLLVATAVVVTLVRAEIIPPGRWRALFYRVGLLIPTVLSYFEMRYVMPALALPLLDHPLLAIDQAIFDVTPSVWLERFNELPIVEWFAFFYWSYFVILALMWLPPLFLEKGRRQIELYMGSLVVACLGHIGYTLVPGLGPYATITFDGPLQGGFWWDMVETAVTGAGAMMDIFPSLHTALPTFFALHAFGHRDHPLWRWVWPVLAFMCMNIIIATMFLRWHYGIDVIFGLLLAITARRVGVWVGEKEEQRGRNSDRRQRVWEPLFRYQE